MNKKPLLERLPAFIAIPLITCTLVPLAYITFWWSEHINGVEPKSGQRKYVYKTIDGIPHYRRAGLKHKATKWKPQIIPEFYSNMDICSMYPSIIK